MVYQNALYQSMLAKASRSGLSLNISIARSQGGQEPAVDDNCGHLVASLLVLLGMPQTLTPVSSTIHDHVMISGSDVLQELACVDSLDHSRSRSARC